MLIEQETSVHIGKTIKKIESDSATLHMCDRIKIIFTDDSTICLGLDWRGRDYYISQREDK